MDMYEFTKCEIDIRIGKLKDFIEEEELKIIKVDGRETDFIRHSGEHLKILKTRLHEYESLKSFLEFHEVKRLGKNVIAEPRRISTGEPSTLKTYRNIAKCFSPFDGESEAVKYFDDLIKKSPNGENEIVLADESQMLLLIKGMVKKQKERNKGVKK